MGQNSEFLNRVKDQIAPRAAADQDPQELGDALTTHKAKRKALFSDETPKKFINAAPKFSTGPRSKITRFPTKTDRTRRAP